MPFSYESDESDPEGETMVGALGEQLLPAEFGGELTAVALDPFERWLLPL